MHKISDNIYTLGELDMIWISSFAAMMHAAKTGTPERKRADRMTGFQIHLIGAIGEYVASRYLKCKIDTNIYKRTDGGKDLTYRGWSVQVKTRTYQGKNPDMIIDSSDHVSADIFINTKISDVCSIHLDGWMWKDDVLEKGIKKNYGYGDRIACLCSDMRPMIELLDIEPKP